MADWTTTLPDTAVEGETTHIEDHNAIVAAIAEARTVVDAAEATIASLQGLLDGKADDGHKHAAADVTSGTFDAARIPALPQSKVTGLTAALDGKQDTGDYATTAQVEAKADQTALDALEARVTTLEGAGA
ncbi:MAG TPA: hypothetical protein VK065_01665 [Brevibacterium sp.]|nr:hypothetical protein [Brevibacterium sp.]